MPLTDPEGVALKVFLCNEPRLARGIMHAAYADAFALAKRVEGKSNVLSDYPAVRCANGPRMCWEIAVKKFPEGALADEADSGGILLGGIRQTDLRGNATNIALVEPSYREEHSGNLLLSETVQKVTLVFARINAAQELCSIFSAANSRVVAGGNPVSPHLHGMV